MSKMSAQEIRWQTESDAGMLTNYPGKTKHSVRKVKYQTNDFNQKATAFKTMSTKRGRK